MVADGFHTREEINGALMPEPVLETRGLIKRFGVLALQGSASTFAPVKSTPCAARTAPGNRRSSNALGLYPYGSYEGEFSVTASPALRGHVDSERAGLSVIHQELALVAEMTVAENVFLGHEPQRFGFVNRRPDVRRTIGCFAASASTSTRPQFADLGMGQKQLVEIARALAKNARS